MNTFRSFARMAYAAIVLVALAVVPSLAQKIDWQAGELASPFPAKQSEEELIKQLQTASVEGKAMACKQLSIYGSKACVSELAKLLSDEHLASWARIALEAPIDLQDHTVLVAVGV